MQQIILDGISVEDFQNQLIGKIKSEFFSTTPVHAKETGEDEFLTVSQVAKLLSISKVTVHHWKKVGKLPFHRFGTRIRFKKSEILNNEKFSKGKK